MPQQPIQDEQPKEKKNYWKWILITLGILALFIIPISYNKATEKCAIGKYEDGFCKSQVNETLIKEGLQTCDGITNSTCIIDAKGNLENPKLIYTIFILFGVITIIILIFKYIRKPTIELDSPEYKKYNPNIAKKAIERYFVEEFKIPHQTFQKFNLLFWKKSEDENITYPEGTFEWYDHHQPFIKSNGEWFFQAQLQINSKINSGIYTVLVSLARDLNEIHEGLFRWGRSLFEYYKLDEMHKPFYQPRTERQKIYERLINLGREDLLTQLAEKEAESLITKIPSDRIPQQSPQFPAQQPQIPQQQYYRRPYQPYRRRYY